MKTSLLFHSPHQFPALVGQAVFLDAVGRPGHLVIEKMRHADHTETRVVEAIQVVQVALERVRAFEPQEAADDSVSGLRRSRKFVTSWPSAGSRAFRSSGADASCKRPA